LCSINTRRVKEGTLHRYIACVELFNSQYNWVGVSVMVLYTTFNNISTISWQSALLVEETGVARENHRHVTSHWQIYHIVLHGVHLAWTGFEFTMMVVIGADGIGSYKSNNHMNTTTTTPNFAVEKPHRN
jgi:hypothetical protein